MAEEEKRRRGEEEKKRRSLFLELPPFSRAYELSPHQVSPATTFPRAQDTRLGGKLAFPAMFPPLGASPARMIPWTPRPHIAGASV